MWVAANISYDYQVYYSSNGSTGTNIHRMLRSRRGICLDYATLMDTLCSLSGLQNVTVVGYAKDDVFDVNDSIYVDNHAWNAVKLDGRWYLYDVTWASGDIEYQYRPFSKWLIKMKERYPPKYKKKKIPKRKRFLVVDECGNESRSEDFYYKEIFTRRLLRNMLDLFSLRVTYSYTKRVNMEHYLVNPEVFAITHFPDNPVWALLGKTSMRRFETDSAYYHFRDVDHHLGSRSGRVCTDCDNELSLSDLGKHYNMRTRSSAFNPRNRFITSLCEYYIAGIHLKDGNELIDSAAKVNRLDSALLFSQFARGSLKTAYRNVDTDFLLQKNKNKRKQMLLLTDNQLHTNFVRTNINITMIHKRSTKALESRGLAVTGNLRSRNRQINGYATPVIIATKDVLTEKKRKEYVDKHDKSAAAVDSMRLLVEHCKLKYDSLLVQLSFNVWRKVFSHDSLILPILASTDLRIRRSDNYKKNVVEVRKQIPIFEKNYSRDLNYTVYEPALRLSEAGKLLFHLIERRNTFEKELYYAKLLLVKFNQLSPEDLTAYQREIIAENKDNYCWLRNRLPALKAATEGFKVLRVKQTRALKTIVRENEIERRRTYLTNNELLRRKKKYRHIVVNNTMVVSQQTSTIRKAKRVYLNQLKRERRKAAKKD